MFFLATRSFAFGLDNRNQTFLLSQLGGIEKMCNFVLGFLIVFVNFIYLLIFYLSIGIFFFL